MLFRLTFKSQRKVGLAGHNCSLAHLRLGNIIAVYANGCAAMMVNIQH